MRARVVMLAGVLVCATAAQATGPRVVVDPGHGGPQEGALSPSGYQEKTLSLEMATRLKEALEKALDADVLLTREEDVQLGLADRVALSNRLKPDLFISADEYRARMDTLMRRIHDCPKAEGFSEVLVPGELEAREEAKRRRSGIPFSRGELATLREEAAKAGIGALETSDRPLGGP